MSLRDKAPHIPQVKTECKCILVGDNGVGMSSFMERFVHDTCDGVFVDNPSIVLGEIYFDYKGANSRANVTAFPFGFDRNILPGLCKMLGEPDLLMVLFSFDSLTSLESVKTHINEMRVMFADIPVIVIGNKCDLVDRSVTSSNITTACSDWPVDVTYLEASALTGDGVRDSIGAAISRVKGEDVQI